MIECGVDLSYHENSMGILNEECSEKPLLTSSWCYSACIMQFMFYDLE